MFDVNVTGGTRHYRGSGTMTAWHQLRRQPHWSRRHRCLLLPPPARRPPSLRLWGLSERAPVLVLERIGFADDGRSGGLPPSSRTVRVLGDLAAGVGRTARGNDRKVVSREGYSVAGPGGVGGECSVGRRGQPVEQLGFQSGVVDEVFDVAQVGHAMPPGLISRALTAGSPISRTIGTGWPLQSGLCCNRHTPTRRRHT